MNVVGIHVQYVPFIMMGVVYSVIELCNRPPCGEGGVVASGGVGRASPWQVLGLTPAPINPH